MFTKFYLLPAVVACLLGIAVVSCGDDEPDYPYYPPSSGGSNSGNDNTERLSASPEKVEFTASGGKQTVSLSGVSGSVTVTKSDWISVSRITDSSYKLEVTSNSGSARSGYVTFRCNCGSASVDVTQSGGSGSGGNQGGGNQGGGTTVQKPAAPTGLVATPDGPSTAPYTSLRWQMSSGATQYIVSRSTSAYGSYTRIATVSTYAYNDENVKYGKTYYYKVQASNSAGTSEYSDYAMAEFTDRRKPGPASYGNCTVSGTTMYIRWSVPKDASYGTPTKALLRVRHPDTGDYVDLQTLSGTATSTSFTYTPWVDKNGYVYVGIILENDNGTGGGTPKIWNDNTKRWMN